MAREKFNKATTLAKLNGEIQFRITIAIPNILTKITRLQENLLVQCRRIEIVNEIKARVESGKEI